MARPLVFTSMCFMSQATGLPLHQTASMRIQTHDSCASRDARNPAPQAPGGEVH